MHGRHSQGKSGMARKSGMALEPGDWQLSFWDMDPKHKTRCIMTGLRHLGKGTGQSEAGDRIPLVTL